MKFETRRLSDLKVFENNPRSNTNAVPKVKESITRYGYKVPIVIDRNDVIVAGHTRFAALLQINEETGQYSEITVVIADDLTENQIKQFRIVDNQVADIAEWDFTKLRIELDDIEDFILDDFGIISGFNTDIHIADEDPQTETSGITISVGPHKINMTEQEYHDWANYVSVHHDMTILDFVKRQLHISSENRQYKEIDI